jgi:putative ATPase
LRDANRDGQGFGHGAGYLYPHAYRDHWVAQQYLPSSLQGKLFYQPSDQGYEKSIGERVCRLREAQLEAILDENDSSALFAPEKSSGKGQWVQRTHGNSAEQLGRIREKIMSVAELSRTDLVLDLNTGSGLLTLEAARCTPDGGVWALVHDQKSFSTMSKLIERFNPLERPQLVLTDWHSFDTDLKKTAGENVKFDRIIGRAVLAGREKKKDLFDRIVKLLNKKGKIVLAETVYSEGQRLSELLNRKRMDVSLMEKLIAAESELFNDPSDHLVNWTPESLEEQIGQIDGMKISFDKVTENNPRIFKSSDIEFWFRKTGGTGRLSLGERLEKSCDSREIEEIKKELHVQLDNKSHSWKNVTLFISVQERVD